MSIEKCAITKKKTHTYQYLRIISHATEIPTPTHWSLSEIEGGGEGGIEMCVQRTFARICIFQYNVPQIIHDNSIWINRQMTPNPPNYPSIYSGVPSYYILRLHYEKDLKYVTQRKQETTITQLYSSQAQTADIIIVFCILQYAMLIIHPYYLCHFH